MLELLELIEPELVFPSAYSPVAELFARHFAAPALAWLDYVFRNLLNHA